MSAVAASELRDSARVAQLLLESNRNDFVGVTFFAVSHAMLGIALM
jgi:hypothetical protein